MCTAVQFTAKDHYFGRNLDLEYHYDENVVIAPRRFPLPFRKAQPLHTHYAMIGVGIVVDGYPLFYDAANEHGVCIAGLNFPGNAAYMPYEAGCDNIAPYELIPWVLGQCRNMEDVRALLQRISLLDQPFSAAYPLSPLHWMIAWKSESIVVESMRDGLHVCQNPVGVLTNNPPFDMQLFAYKNRQKLAAHTPASDMLAPGMRSNGMETLGLPGDLTSPSRFVRAAFMLKSAQCGATETERISQFFHILGSVAMPRGSVMVGGKPEITVYSSCCNADKGVYYYTTYDNSRITGVDMRRENLDSDGLIAYPLMTDVEVFMQN